MKRVLTAVVLIPIVLLIVFRAPHWVYVSVIGVVALLALFEFAALVRAHGIEFDHRLLTILFVLFFGAAALRTDFGPWQLAPVALFAVIIMNFATRRSDLKQVLPTAGCGILALLYLGATLMALVVLREYPWGKFLLLYVFVVVWSGDTFAYYTGRVIGRHKLAPLISPGKTWEGTVASIVGSTFLGTLMFVSAPAIVGFLESIGLLSAADAVTNPAWLSPAIWEAIVMSACINWAAQMGDLAESAIKRGAGVKDSGNLLPGHGGILDRIDALLFAAPVGLVLIQVILPNRP